MSDTQTIVFSKQIILTNDQIIQLPTTSVEVIPAPGVGKAILLTDIRYKANISVAYGNISSFADGAYLYLAYSNTTGGNDGFTLDTGIQNTSFADYMTGLLQNPIPNIYMVLPLDVRYGGTSREWYVELLDVPSMENSSIKTCCFNNAGNYTGGDAANEIKIMVCYTIVDL